MARTVREAAGLAIGIRHVDALAGLGITAVDGTQVTVVAVRRLMHALSCHRIAVVVGASVAVVTVPRNMNAQCWACWVTEVIRARIAVIAIDGLMNTSAGGLAAVILGARIVVFAIHRLELARSGRGITVVVRTGIPIITHDIKMVTHAVLAEVLRTGVPVVALLVRGAAMIANEPRPADSTGALGRSLFFKAEPRQHVLACPIRQTTGHTIRVRNVNASLRGRVAEVQRTQISIVAIQIAGTAPLSTRCPGDAVAPRPLGRPAVCDAHTRRPDAETKPVQAACLHADSGLVAGRPGPLGYAAKREAVTRR